MLASRKNLQRGFRSVRRKLFSKESLRKIPHELPNHCWTAAISTQQSHSKPSTWPRGPQAVRKYSCLDNTLWKTQDRRADTLLANEVAAMGSAD